MSDEYVKRKLHQYGLQCLEQIFQANEIDESVWPSLNEDVLRDLIPQIGLRIKFQKKFGPDQAETVNIKCDTEENTDEIFLEADIEEESENTNEIFLVADIEEQSGSTCEDTASSVVILKETVTEDNGTTNNEILETSLKQLLESSPKGKYILGLYAMKKKLDSDSRNKLSEIIIEHELGPDPDKRLSRHEFTTLASQIASTFPGESKDLYFRVVCKRCPNGKFKKDGQGKLFSKYYNLRKSLKRVGILSREQVDEDIELHENDYQDTSEETRAWLKNNIEPWGQVEMFWRKTLKARQNELKDTAIYSYYATYRVLRENRGFTLLESDFNSLYPEQDMNLYANWTEFAKKVIVNAKQAKDKNIQQYLSVYDNATDEDVKQFVTLKILPNLLRAQTVSKKYKPSKEEVQQAFIFHIKRIEDLHINLEEKKKKLLHLGLTFQPTPIVIANSEDDISECFVAVDEVLYNVCTPLKAIELCFKITHALNAKYSPEAEHIWLCVQKDIFKIHSKYDKTYTSVTQFLED